MDVVDIAITVERDRSSDRSILSAVESAGFTIDRAMPVIATIYGHGPAEHMESVRHIDGVVGVREAGRYQLPPFNRVVPQ